MKPRHTTPRRAGSPGRRTRSSERPKTTPRTGLPVPHAGSALQLFEPDPSIIYTIEAASRLAGVPRRTILIYCKHKLVSPAHAPESQGCWFTADAVRALRQIHELRCSRCRDELKSLVTILALVDQIQKLRQEIHLQRE